MEEQSPHQEFEKEFMKNYEDLVKDYSGIVDKARDDSKHKAHNGFLNTIRDQFYATQTMLGKYARLLSDIEHELEGDKYKTFEELYDQRFLSIELPDKDNVLKGISKLKALDKMFSFLAKEGLKFEDEAGQKSRTNIEWKGKIELEFVQLIYALHEAKYLQNKEDEITTLVKQVAEVFNYELGEYWQSNLSDCINNRNTDYKPKIFENLQKGFNFYRERQEEINKKKKPK